MKRLAAVLAAAAIAVSAALALGADVPTAPTPAPTPPVPELVPRAKLVKAVHARDRAEASAHRLRVQLRRSRHFEDLVRHPTQANNRELARLLYPDGFWALDKIAAGGDGIGGAPGESDWHETVWNGGGLDPAAPGPTAQSCSGDPDDIAYGIGQACPRSKMVSWAGTPAVLVVASLQIHWMNAYGTGRYGSLAAAGAHWSIEGSW